MRGITVVLACTLAASTVIVRAQVEADGATALHRAVQVGDWSAARRLIVAGARVDAANRYGVTPLAIAARQGQTELVEALLAAGASVRAAEAGLPEGQTLLMLAARAGDAVSLKRFAAVGSNPNARETRTGTTALIWAAVANRAAAVRALVEAGADLDVRSKVTAYPHTQSGVLLTGKEAGVSYVGQTVLPRGGWSALIYAAREGALDAARALIDAGADRNATDPESTSALIIAIINGHFDVARLLIERGADLNLADIKGMTPLYAAVDMHTLGTTFGRPAPPRPVLDQSVGVVELLLARGADPNRRLSGPILKRVYDAGDGRLGEGATALMRAARRADAGLMRRLIAAGADATLVQKSGATPVMLAIGAVSAGGGEEDGRVTEDDASEAVQIALAAGVDVNAAGSNGDTALHAAATTAGGLPAVIRLLAAAGARTDVKNKAGRTPLEAAERAREPNQAVIALLRPR
jgi:ankyrin repeat protein